MITGDIKNKKIARTYSNALIQTAQDNSLTEKVLEDLTFINELLNSNNELYGLLKSPVITLDDKKDIISKLLTSRVDKITLDFILLLLDNNRLGALQETLSQYIKTYNNINNIITPVIISAIELDEERRSRVKDKLKEKFSKTIRPQYQVNPEIIGGLVIEIEDKKLDFSLKSKFDDMKKELTKGNRYGNN